MAILDARLSWESPARNQWVSRYGGQIQVHVISRQQALPPQFPSFCQPAEIFLLLGGEQVLPSSQFAELSGHMVQVLLQFDTQPLQSHVPAHGLHCPPPQSMQNSIAFLTPSWHRHTRLPLQTSGSGSLHSRSGSRPLTIAPHIPSEPMPFFWIVQASHTPSQASLQQTLSAQYPVVQSPGARQAIPVVHGIQFVPPQSTSVSFPSFAPF
jgi:hypothetical protein